MSGIFNAWTEGRKLVLASRNEVGDLALRRVSARRTASIDAEWLQEGDRRRQLLAHKSVLGLEESSKFVEVLFSDHDRRKVVCDWIKGEGGNVYEADLSPVGRHLADGADDVAKPRVVYLDLETDSRVPFSRKEEMRILSWALVSNCDIDDAEFFCVKGDEFSDVLSDDTDEAERAILEELLSILEHFDAISAWNGDRFDFPVVKARCPWMRPEEWDRWLLLDQLEVFKKYNLASESGEEKQSMALGAIAQALLGEGKRDVDASKTYELWLDDPAKLVDYNMQDTRLLFKIEQKTGYLDLFATVCCACNCFVETRSLMSTVLVDGYVLRLGRQEGMRFPTKERTESEGKFLGAYVADPPVNVGVLRNVHVADFAAMYPSIIRTWNMSPDTLRAGAGALAEAAGAVADYTNTAKAPQTGWRFDQTTEGLFPRVLRMLMGMRKEHADRKAACAPGTSEWHDADAKSTAYKVIANSFYGATGSEFSRFYDRRVAESVSTTGRWLLEETMKFAREAGFEPIYADTDSIFCKGERLGFDRLVGDMNADLYPRIVSELGCKESCIKLAYEKEFERLVFVSAKKYAGKYAHFKGKAAVAGSKPEVRGLEYRRGDASKLARELQGEIIKFFCDGIEDPTPYVQAIERMKSRILDSKLMLNDVVIAQQLTQPIKDYKATTPPAHVRIAKILIERGAEVGVGSKVRYVIADGSVSPAVVIPAADWTGECDRHDVWEDRVWPPTKRVVESLFPTGEDWTRFDRTRPPKPRKLSKKAIVEQAQAGLFDVAIPAAITQLEDRRGRD
jgi:DNA polymerase elongation subunit (family B)